MPPRGDSPGESRHAAGQDAARWALRLPREKPVTKAKVAGGLACPGGAGIARGLGSCGSSLRPFPITIHRCNNKSCAASKGISITFYAITWVSIPTALIGCLIPMWSVQKARCPPRPRELLCPVWVWAPRGVRGSGFGALAVPGLPRSHRSPVPPVGKCRLDLAWASGGFAGAARDYSPPELRGKLSTKNGFSVNLFWLSLKKSHKLQATVSSRALKVQSWRGSC